MSDKRFSDYIMRNGLKYSHERFSHELKGQVAFIGGSVTTQTWRVMTSQFLSQIYPDTKFNFINAGIGGTDANLGAFRFPHHVFMVDLLFLEFAVNGGGIRAMEGIVRQAKRLNPKIDIIMLYLADTNKLKDFNAGKIPDIVQNHEKVAEHYKIPVLYLYREISRRIADGLITWEQFSRDSVHPTEFGNEIYAQCVSDFLKDALASDRSGELPGELPEPLDPLCYEKGHFIDLEEAKEVKGWQRIPEWTTDKTCNWRPPADVLSAEEPGATLRLDFEGTAIGLYTLVGMDTGIIEYSIDDSPFQAVDQFDHYCPMFHRPQHKIFADELSMGKHKIILRTGKEKNEKSLGHSTRILKFMVN